MKARGLRAAALWTTSIAMAAVLAGTSAAAAGPITFNPLAGEFPEGIAFDHQGNTFVSLSPRGEIREIAVDGTQSTYAAVSPAGQGFGPVGLAFDAAGDLFVAAATFNPATVGVYEIAKGTHTAQRLTGSEQIAFPNGLAFDDTGALYATDTLLGAVWRLSPGSTPTEVVQTPLLEGDGSFGFGVPLGANGIAFRHGSLYVTATEKGRVVRIPISANGVAGTPQLVVESQQLVGADGCQFDVHGGLYIAVNAQNKIVRLDPDGTITVIASAADGLDFPASPLFGVGHGDRSTLFVTNFAFNHANPADAHPGVLSFPVGVPGQPLAPGGSFTSSG